MVNLLKILIDIILVCFMYYIVNLVDIVFSFRGTYKKNYDFDYILIMGTKISNELDRRIRVANKLLINEPDKKIIVSGGKMGDKEKTEAQYMYKKLIESGVPKEKIILEDKALTSYNNLLFSAEIVGNKKVFVVISSPYHLLRIKLISKRLKLTCYTKSSGYHIYLKGIIREPIALLFAIFFKK